MPICKICTTLGEDFTSKNPEPLRNRRRIELISGRNYPCHVIYRRIQSDKRKLQLERLNKSDLACSSSRPISPARHPVRSLLLVIPTDLACSSSRPISPARHPDRSRLLVTQRGPVQVNVQQQVRSRQLVIERGTGVIRKSDVTIQR
ncbi:hypothetical protein pipiens_008009, partial [Culex pipiens pipiens]